MGWIGWEETAGPILNTWGVRKTVRYGFIFTELIYQTCEALKAKSGEKDGGGEALVGIVVGSE